MIEIEEDGRLREDLFGGCWDIAVIILSLYIMDRYF